MKKILYVEDNEDNVYVLKSRLARAGYTVLIAADGAQGVTMAVAEQPNLILMDLSLPVLDVWEATRRIKAMPELRKIPIIALTAHAMATDRDKAVPVVNQIRRYWWCSPPRIGRQRMCPVSSTAREIGASFCKDKCVRISL